MMFAYVALAGEYEEYAPLGVFDTLEKAKKAVEDSKPTYSTCVYLYELFSGEVVNEWLYERNWDGPVGSRKVFFWKDKE